MSHLTTSHTHIELAEVLNDSSMPDRETTQSVDYATSEADAYGEFFRLIGNLPTEYQLDFYKTLEKMISDMERRRRVIEAVQESLAQMRMDLKYLVFDLEATRRERDEYRSQLLWE